MSATLARLLEDEEKSIHGPSGVSLPYCRMILKMASRPLGQQENVLTKQIRFKLTNTIFHWMSMAENLVFHFIPTSFQMEKGPLKEFFIFQSERQSILLHVLCNSQPISKIRFGRRCYWWPETFGFFAEITQNVVCTHTQNLI